jgi:hypothetical protein
MAEKKVIEIEVKDNSKTLKQQYKEAVIEVQKLADAYGEASVEFQEASKRAGELKDKIGDVNQRVKNLSSDTQKLDAALSAGSGIAGAFSIAEGAMATFGVESQDLQKSLLKVQGAMAVLNGVQAVANALNKDSALMVQLQAKNLTVASVAQKAYALAVGTSTGFMKAFKLALISIGIGALIVGLGLLIANFDKVTKVVSTLSGYLIKAYDYFDNLGTSIKVLIGIFFPFIGVVYGAIKALEYFNVIDTKNERDMSARHVANIKRIDKELAKREEQRKARKKAYDEETGNIDRQIKLLEAQGKSTVELEKLQLRRSLANQRELIKEARLNLQILRATNAMGVNDELIEETLTSIAQMKQGILNTETDLQLVRINAEKDAKKEIKTNQDLAKTLEDLTEKNKQFGLSEKELLLLSKLKTDALIQEQFLKSTDKDKEKQRTDALLANETDYNNQLNALRKKEVSDYETLKTTSAKDGIAQLVTTRTAELQIEKDTADKKRKLDEDEIARKKRLRNTQVQLAADAFGAIGQLIESFNAKDEASARRQFKISKAFNLAAALTNTYLAVTGALTAGGNPIKLATGQQFVEAGIAGTVGLANVVKIASTQFGGGGGGNTDVPNPSSIIAPNLNVVGNTGINQLATLQQQPVKAYVVSNDITSAQQFDLKVQQTAQL